MKFMRPRTTLCSGEADLFGAKTQFDNFNMCRHPFSWKWSEFYDRAIRPQTSEREQHGVLRSRRSGRTYYNKGGETVI
jgi:hypothetical protein